MTSKGKIGVYAVKLYYRVKRENRLAILSFLFLYWIFFPPTIDFDAKKDP